MQRRRRTRPTTSFEQRLSDAAKALRERASGSAGSGRENLLRQARQAETAAHINQWLSSPGLASPK